MTSASSISLAPSPITPSTGMRSKARTSTSSPDAMAAIATSSIRLPRMRRAVGGRSAISSRSARVVPRLARASSALPHSTKVMTTAAASK